MNRVKIMTGLLVAASLFGCRTPKVTTTKVDNTYTNTTQNDVRVDSSRVTNTAEQWQAAYDLFRQKTEEWLKTQNLTVTVKEYDTDKPNAPLKSERTTNYNSSEKKNTDEVTTLHALIEQQKQVIDSLRVISADLTKYNIESRTKSSVVEKETMTTFEKMMYAFSAILIILVLTLFFTTRKK